MPTVVRRQIRLLILLASILISAGDKVSVALTPESPEVKQAIARAVKFLETSTSPDNRMGAHAIRATLVLKSGAGEDHPIVRKAVQAIRRDLEGLNGVPKDHVIYSVSLSLIFFCNLDSQHYAAEINRLIQYLLSVQKPHGGWGYEDKPTGDTSMTQHVILAFWEAAEAGFNIPQSSVERAAMWFLKTQDPSGAFGYQGNVSESYLPVPQTEIRHSCCAAAMGSIYMCAELLGLADKLGARARETDSLPPALARLDRPGAGQPVRFQSKLDPGLFRTVMGRGNRWLEENHTISPPIWPYYLLYSIERYWTFRELIDGNASQVARWYDEAAAHLLKVQKADGSWYEPHISTNPENHTCFAALFLLRSTKKSVEKVRSFGSGTLVGGRGLPKDSELVRIQGGKVVSTAEASDLRKLLEQIDGGNEEEYTKAIGAVSQLPPEEAKALVSRQAARLRELAGGTSADQRLAAVEALARAGTLGDVPTLIYAISDPEREIVLAARDGLRRISRKTRGFQMPDDFDEGDRRSAIDQWKRWYLAIRPDAEFEN
jgi:hypothetical protein